MTDELTEREMVEGLGLLANWTRHLYLCLLAEGFSTNEALALSEAWLVSVITEGTS